MPHTITVNRTTTTTSSSGFFLNLSYVKSITGILKLLQLILGTVVIGIVGNYYRNAECFGIIFTADTFFLIIAVTFLIGTFILFISCVLSMSTASLILETLYETVYHCLAFILYLSASITFIIKSFDRPYNPVCNVNDAYKTAAIFGFVITILYLCSALYSQKTRVGGLIGR